MAESVDQIPLSEYGEASKRPAPVNAMMASFARDFRDGIDVNLGVGYVEEATIPRERILEAMEAVLSRPDQYRAALNYGGPAGSPNLIESIRRFLCGREGNGLTREILDQKEIIVGPNGATSLLESIGLVLRPGIVLTSDPMYYIYCHFLERRGFEVVAVPEDEEGIRTDLLRERLDALGDRKEEIRFLYAVSVGNPTSTILSNARRRDLVEIAEELTRRLGRKVPLVLDEAYGQLVHDPQVGPLESALACDRTGVVYEIGSLSKILAPGLRIGYLIGPGGPFVDALVQRTSDAGFSAPLINQEIASWLLDEEVAGQIDRVNQGYREKASRIRRWIDEELGSVVVECRGGRAGFYFYLTLDGVDTREGSPFFRFLARTTGRKEFDGPPEERRPRVAYVPGEFCVHPRGDLVEEGKRQLRLSYGYESAERIREALGYMRQAVEYAAG